MKIVSLPSVSVLRMTLELVVNIARKNCQFVHTLKRRPMEGNMGV
jgi:hypothetical protein